MLAVSVLAVIPKRNKIINALRVFYNTLLEESSGSRP